eukprot:CAMPEP_0113310338 /NCGR_PEP_ID=MMETSP0010_2-20120614/8024_1 /TAXON_ID=216773 ORGANISM="Corethron hystrix, Strain 308" /NCGR_SAMPLE_ID=MMETSP0010_2 /ASSEMBLY_ACC=CAM_ASM_000155 /LENGTH=428 /DNA_ID=CAMNT_0000165775 /DNA_START=63 /DNA_END=1349 /DNA_ORIENTATION=+ /assembly_acc=CAM_ASM_000155
MTSLRTASLALLLSRAVAFVPRGLPFAPPSALRAAPFDHAAAFLSSAAPAPDAFSSVLLADGVDVDSTLAAKAGFEATAAALGAVDTAGGAADAASDAAQSAGPGFMGFLVGPVESLLVALHSVLGDWGLDIIGVTLLIKLITFPLTKVQLESSSKMQLLQPQIKGIQAKYQSNPEEMNKRISAVYQDNEVNPLAGCLPALVQIPVFIGLYRAVLDLAKEDKLEQPFLWLPNLEGPTYGADPAHASDWILKGWHDGAPSLGWEDTIAFLSIPLILIVLQAVSTQLMQPPKNPDDPNDPSNNVVLKALPLLIGWFSLNVPSALGIYWITNTLVSTLSTVLIKNSLAGSMPAAAAAAESPVVTQSASVYSPPVREKPAGFGSAVEEGGVTPITSDAVEAEIMEEDGETEASSSAATSQKKKKKKKKKRRN